MHEVSLEISDVHLRLNKTSQRLNKDTELRDAVRERDAPAIAEAIWAIISEALEGMDQPDQPASAPKAGLKGKSARDVAELAVRAAGDYVSWIDINLMVTPTTIGLLLRCVNLPAPPAISVRSATTDALIETVSKGMPASDKLKLFEVLDLGTVLSALVDVGRESGRKEAETEQIELFREKLAKLLNGVGTELCKIIDDVRAAILAAVFLADVWSARSLPAPPTPRSPLPRWRLPSSRFFSAFSSTLATTPRSPSMPSLPPFSPSTRRRRSAPAPARVSPTRP